MNIEAAALSQTLFFSSLLECAVQFHADQCRINGFCGVALYMCVCVCARLNECEAREEGGSSGKNGTNEFLAIDSRNTHTYTHTYTYLLKPAAINATDRRCSHSFALLLYLSLLHSCSDISTRRLGRHLNGQGRESTNRSLLVPFFPSWWFCLSCVCSEYG